MEHQHNHASNQNRKVHLDFLRILAIFLVVFNHTEGFHLYLTQSADGSLSSIMRVFSSCFTAINIPTFFMISGALLLGRQENYRTLFKKRILRIIIVLLFFSSLSYIIIDHRYPFSPEYFRSLFSCKIDLSHWFLFAYLGFLVSLPLLRKIAVSLSRADMILLLVLNVFWGSVLPIYMYFCSAWNVVPVMAPVDFQIPFATFKYFFYPLLGYYLDKSLDIRKLRPRHICALSAVFLSGISIATFVTYHQGIYGQFTQDYISMFITTTCASLFLLIRYLFDQILTSAHISNWLASISRLTFGVYLMDPLLRYFLYYRFGGTMDRMAYSILWCIFSMFVCCCITYILRKTSIGKKFL